MGLKHLKNKFSQKHEPIQAPEEPYNPPPAQQKDLNSWQESESIMALHTFLERHSDQDGIFLVLCEGCPTVRFWPGIKFDELEKARWQVAQTALNLLVYAADDMKNLLERGLMTLPEVPPIG